MTPTEALATALNAVFDAIDFKNPHKSLSAIAAILAALDGYELVRPAAPAEGLSRAIVLMCNETIKPEPDVLERIQRIGYAALNPEDDR